MKKENILEIILKPYKKSVHFLKSFELVDNKGIGIFRTKSNFYTIFNTANHFTATELQICLNQLLYIYIANHLNFKFIIDSYTINEVLNIQKDNTFITEIFIKFNQPIDSTKDIKGEIELIRSKNIGSIVFFECKFNFEEKFYGSVKAIYKI